MALAHREQGDFIFKMDELFDDDFFAVTAHARTGNIPAAFDVCGGVGHALAFAR